MLDLEDETDLAFALRLADHADVVVENFRPGVADKLGIGAEALTAATRASCTRASPGSDRPGRCARSPRTTSSCRR